MFGTVWCGFSFVAMRLAILLFAAVAVAIGNRQQRPKYRLKTVPVRPSQAPSKDTCKSTVFAPDTE